MGAQMSAFDPKRTLKARHETAPGSNLETGTASWGRAGHSVGLAHYPSWSTNKWHLNRLPYDLEQNTHEL